jgi:hypothetical protein
LSRGFRACGRGGGRARRDLRIASPPAFLNTSGGSSSNPVGRVEGTAPKISAAKHCKYEVFSKSPLIKPDSSDSDYIWFLEVTADISKLSEDLKVPERKSEIFRRADLFGERVYKALAFIAESKSYARYLVI